LGRRKKRRFQFITFISIAIQRLILLNEIALMHVRSGISSLANEANNKKKYKIFIKFSSRNRNAFCKLKMKKIIFCNGTQI
jgi:hypothetical protein